MIIIIIIIIYAVAIAASRVCLLVLWLQQCVHMLANGNRT